RRGKLFAAGFQHRPVVFGDVLAADADLGAVFEQDVPADGGTALGAFDVGQAGAAREDHVAAQVAEGGFLLHLGFQVGGDAGVARVGGYPGLGDGQAQAGAVVGAEVDAGGGGAGGCHVPAVGDAEGHRAEGVG